MSQNEPLPDIQYARQVVADEYEDIRIQYEEVCLTYTKWMRHDNQSRLRAVRLNTTLVTACASGDLATVRELIPDTCSAMRGAPARLNRRHKTQWAYPVQDGLSIMYDFEAFWLDLDSRPYGRNRQFGIGHMQWDVCEENSAYPDLVGHTALTAASQNGHVIILEHLCSVTPIIPHLNEAVQRRYKHLTSTSRSRGDYPCHLAVRGGHWKSLRQLIRHAQLSTRVALNPLFTRNHDKLTPCNVGSCLLRGWPNMNELVTANIRMCMLLLVCYGDNPDLEVCYRDAASLAPQQMLYLPAPFLAVLDIAKRKGWGMDIGSYWNISQIENRTAQILPLLPEAMSGDMCKIIAEYDVELTPEFLLHSPLPHDVIDAFFFAMVKLLDASITTSE